MKKITLILFVLNAITFITCEKSFEPIQVYSEKKVVMIKDVQNFNFDSIQIDSFYVNSFQIDENADIIKFNVSYSGGCRDHQFSLYSTYGILYSNPAGCLVYLSHNANGDNCEKLINQTISFSLKPLHHSGSGALILHLHAFKEKSIGTKWYRF